MPAGDRQPYELLMDDEAWAAEPVRVATELGHTVEKDRVDRWTCTRCHRAVLLCGTNIYGSATEGECTGVPFWQRPGIAVVRDEAGEVATSADPVKTAQIMEELLQMARKAGVPRWRLRRQYRALEEFEQANDW